MTWTVAHMIRGYSNFVMLRSTLGRPAPPVTLGGAAGGMGGWGRRGYGGVGAPGVSGGGGAGGMGGWGKLPIPDPVSDILINSNPRFSK